MLQNHHLTPQTPVSRTWTCSLFCLAPLWPALPISSGGSPRQPRGAFEHTRHPSSCPSNVFLLNFPLKSRLPDMATQLHGILPTSMAFFLFLGHSSSALLGLMPNIFPSRNVSSLNPVSFRSQLECHLVGSRRNHASHSVSLP